MQSTVTGKKAAARLTAKPIKAPLDFKKGRGKEMLGNKKKVKKKTQQSIPKKAGQKRPTERLKRNQTKGAVMPAETHSV